MHTLKELRHLHYNKVHEMRKFYTKLDRKTRMHHINYFSDSYTSVQVPECSSVVARARAYSGGRRC